MQSASQIAKGNTFVGRLLELARTERPRGILSLAGEILIPQMVATEFESNALGWKTPQWIKVVELDKERKLQAPNWIRANQIDAGEAEAIGLALQATSDWLLTDDARARQFAESVGLEVHGSIGLLLSVVHERA